MEGRVSRGARIAVVAAALLVVGGGVANAFVLLDPSADKDAIGNRNDIFKQATKFSQCIVKAAQKCEKGQDPLTQQCAFTGSVTNPTTSFTGLDPNNKGIGAKFEADVQKCISKVDFAKKGAKDGTIVTKYTAIGCPGDCDDVTAGDQACSDLTTYQASSGASTLDQVNLLAGLVPALAVQMDPMTDPNGCVPPSSMDMAIFAKELKAFDKCVTSAVSVVAKYAAALQKCAGACEADYKDKKGNGGDNDGPPSCNFAASADVNFVACGTKALDSANKKPLPAGIAGILPVIGGVLDGATNNLFNKPGNCPP